MSAIQDNGYGLGLGLAQPTLPAVPSTPPSIPTPKPNLDNLIDEDQLTLQNKKIKKISPDPDEEVKQPFDVKKDKCRHRCIAGIILFLACLAILGAIITR